MIKAFGVLKCLTASLWLSHPAFAQIESSTSASDKIQIEGESQIDAFDRLESSSTFSTREIRRGDLQGRTLDEILERVAGTYTADFGGPLLNKAIQIRGGSAAQTEVIIDGVPQRTPFATGIDVSLLSLNFLEEIKVVRGGTTLGSAMGGAVYASSRTAARAPNSAFTLRYGSLQRTEIEALVAGDGLIIGTAYRRSLGNFDFDSQLPNLPSQRKTRSNNDVQVGQLQVSGRHNFLNGKFGHNFSLSVREAGVAGFETQPSEFPRDFRGQAQLSTFWKKGPNRISSFFHGMLIDYSNSNTQERISETLFHNYGLDASTSINFANHTLVPEVFVSRIVSASTEYGNRSRIESWLKLQDQFTVSDIDWLVQLRTYWDSDFGLQLQPGVGATYFLSEEWLWRSSLGRAFRAPTLDELYHPTQNGYAGNPELQPESSWEFETGVRWLADSNLQFDIVSYFRRMEDLILTLNRNAFEIRPENAGGANVTGLELESRYAIPTSFFELSLLATTAAMWTQSAVTDEPLPTRPYLTGYVELRLKTPEDISHSIEVFSSWRGLSSTTTNLQGTLTMPAYSRVDVGGSYQISPGAAFTFSVTNILDDKGLMTVNKLPLPGRQFLASLRVSDLAQP